MPGKAGMNGDVGAIWVLGILLVWRFPALAQPGVFLGTCQGAALSYGVTRKCPVAPAWPWEGLHQPS